MTHVYIPGVGAFERSSTTSPWGTEEQVTYRTIYLEPAGRGKSFRLVHWVVGVVLGVA